ncbi:hypothetical protein ACFUEL_32195, partial [Kitasatospora sp. NPDC057198]
SPTRALLVAGPEAKPERAWYRRLVPFVVPVILVAGATTAVELLPYGSPPKETQGSPKLPDSTDPAAPANSAGSTGPSTSGTPTTAGPTPDTGASATPPAAPTPDADATPDAGGPGNGGGRGGSSTGSGSTGGSTGKKSGSTPATTPEPNPAPTRTPAPAPTPAKAYGPRCVFNGQATCSSDDPTVEMTYTGGWTDCTFTFTTTWGDGTTTYTDVAGTGSTDVRKVYATHHYARPGTYTINLRAVTDSGFCLATGGTFTFTLTG